MHELKFRAWDGDRRIVVLCIDFVNMEVDTISHDIEEGEDARAYPLADIVFEQFTGLTDKDGKEICEGDLLRMEGWKPEVMQVAFIEGAFCLADASGEFVADIHYVQHAGRKQAKIIGNIHENTELLKRETKE